MTDTARSWRSGLGAPGQGDDFSRFLGLRWDDPETVRLTIRPDLLNPGGMLIGPAGFALVDYSMGAALWRHTADDELIATTNVSINFVRAATEGDVVCRSTLDRRTRTAATLSARAWQGDELVLTAIGTFSIFPASPRWGRPG